MLPKRVYSVLHSGRSYDHCQRLLSGGSVANSCHSPKIYDLPLNTVCKHTTGKPICKFRLKSSHSGALNITLFLPRE